MKTQRATAAEALRRDDVARSASAPRLPTFAMPSRRILALPVEDRPDPMAAGDIPPKRAIRLRERQ
jgi:hypothetical protein